MSTRKDKTGLLLLAFGAPSGVNEIEPFLRSITGFNQIPENYLKPVMEKYSAIGGTSPFKSITFEVCEKLQFTLGDNFTVVLGLRHSNPLIEEAIKQLLSNDVKKIISLSLTPHYSYFSSGDYIKKVEEILSSQPGIKRFHIKSWHNHSGYINLLYERINKFLNNLGAQSTVILFTAHSLPLEKIPVDDPYLNQLNETITLVKNKFHQNNLDFRLAFQSRRPGKDSWLEPDALMEIEKIHAEGIKHILVVPLSFVLDHLETLYDIDVVMKEKAKKFGLTLTRIPSFNCSDEFVLLLKNIIHDFMEQKRI